MSDLDRCPDCDHVRHDGGACLVTEAEAHEVGLIVPCSCTRPSATEPQTNPRTPSAVMRRQTADARTIVRAAGDRLSHAIGMQPNAQLRTTVEQLVAEGFTAGWQARGPEAGAYLATPQALDDLRRHVDERLDRMDERLDVIVGYVRKQQALSADEPGDRVLIVEDDEDLAREYADAAAVGGLSSEIVGGAGEAIVWISRELPRLLLLDLHLGTAGSGMDALEFLRSRPGGNSVPVFVASRTSDTQVHTFLKKRNDDGGGGILKFMSKRQALANLARAGGNGHVGKTADKSEET